MGAGLSRLSADGVTLGSPQPLRRLAVRHRHRARAAVATRCGSARRRGSRCGTDGASSARLPDGVNPSPFTSNHITGIVVLGDSLWRRDPQRRVGEQPLGRARAWSPVNAPVTATASWTTLHHRRRRSSSGTSARDVYVRPSRWRHLDAFSRTAFRNLPSRGRRSRHHPGAGADRASTAGTDRAGPRSTLRPVSARGPRPDDLAPASRRDGRAVAANVDGLYARARPAERNPGRRRARRTSRERDPQPDVDGPRRLRERRCDEGIGRFDGTRGALATGRHAAQLRHDVPQPVLRVRRRDRSTSGHKWFGMWQRRVQPLDDSDDPPQVIHHTVPATSHQMQTVDAGAARSTRIHGGDLVRHATARTAATRIGPAHRSRLLRRPLGGFVSTSARQPHDVARDHASTALTVDRNGRVWIGFADEGVQYFAWPAAAEPLRFQSRARHGATSTSAR